MAYQKVCKQGKEDIKIKVSMQNPIPTSSLQCKKNVGIDETLYNYLQLYILPSLLHTFLGHAIPSSTQAYLVVPQDRILPRLFNLPQVQSCMHMIIKE